MFISPETKISYRFEAAPDQQTWALRILARGRDSTKNTVSCAGIREKEGTMSPEKCGRSKCIRRKGLERV